MSNAVVSNSEKLAAIDRQSVLHPLLPGTVTERLVVVEGHGSVVVDADGRSYLDGTGGLWVGHIGHGRREIAEVAAAQMSRLEFYAGFWEMTNDRAIALADRLIDLAPAPLEQVFFTSGGSEGNDAAIKMARLFHHRRGQSDRTWILSRRSAYHGVAYGSGTATGLDSFHLGMGPMLPGVRHLTPPSGHRPELFDGQDPVDFCIAELEATIAQLGAERIAAFMGEPIMGVAGMVVPPAGYWRRIKEVLDRHGILLIFDEVVTAFGRAGHWFGADLFGVAPDIMVTAKGITSGYTPLGAVLVSGAVGAAMRENNGLPIGYTYCGHPVSCAVGLANLDILKRESLVARAPKIGGVLSDALAPIQELDVVSGMRHIGMMVGIDLTADKASGAPFVTPPPVAKLLRNEYGIIVRQVGNTLILSPPLVLTEDEATMMGSAVLDALSRLRPDGSLT